MKDSGIEWIGEIPEDWNMQRVKHSFGRKNEKAMQENPIVLSLARSGVKIRDVSNNEGQVAESYYNYNPVEVDDILINPMDLYSGDNCNISKVNGVISPAYINLKSNDYVDPKFYNHYFKLQYWLMAFFAHGKGVSFENRWTLNAETLMNYPIINPSYIEQKRISDYLDSHCTLIDQTIEKQKQVIEKLKKYKQSVITETVTKGLDHNVPMKDSGVEWIGEIPEHWEIVKFGKITQIKSNLVRPLQYLEYKQISSENIEKDTGILLDTNTVEESGIISDNHLFFEGQILYSKIRPKLNKATIAPFDGLCSADIYPIDTRENKKFILYIILSASFNDQVSLVTENRVKMPKINQAELSQILITLPTENEQIEIVNYLEYKCNKIGETIAMKELIIEKLQTYKKSLIYECVTGKQEVK